MHAGRLTVNYVVEGVWAPKFAAGQVCIYTISSRKNICLNTNQKNLPLICFCMQICLTNPNVHTHCFAQKNRCTQSLTPKLHGRSAMMVSNKMQCHLLLLHEKKINTTLIFTVPDIIAKFGNMSGTVKIGFASIFLMSATHRRHAGRLHT